MDVAAAGSVGSPAAFSAAASRASGSADPASAQISRAPRCSANFMTSVAMRVTPTFGSPTMTMQPGTESRACAALDMTESLPTSGIAKGSKNSDVAPTPWFLAPCRAQT